MFILVISLLSFKGREGGWTCAVKTLNSLPGFFSCRCGEGFLFLSRPFGYKCINIKIHSEAQNRGRRKKRINCYPHFASNPVLSGHWISSNKRNSRSSTSGSLSKDIFERRTSIGSEAFPLFICLDARSVTLTNLYSYCWVSFLF